MLNPLTLPPRFRESSFRTYEPLIATIVARYPTRLNIDPADFERSSETVSARLRDAMTSFATHGWESEINLARFKQIHPTLIVSQRGGLVVIGTKETLKDKPDQQIEIEPVPLNLVPPLRVDLLVDSFATLKFLGFLASQRVLSKPIQITVADPQWIAKLYDFYDIEFEEGRDGTFIIT